MTREAGVRGGRSTAPGSTDVTMLACTIDAPGRSPGVPESARQHRGGIHVETGTLLARQEYPGRQYVMRIRSPRCAESAQPGSFAHLRCDPERPMRRPLSIMRANVREGFGDPYGFVRSYTVVAGPIIGRDAD